MHIYFIFSESNIFFWSESGAHWNITKKVSYLLSKCLLSFEIPQMNIVRTLSDHPPLSFTPLPPIILSDLLCFLRPALTVFQNREFLTIFSVVYWYYHNFPWLSRSILMILRSHLNFWTWITFKLFQSISFILTEVFLNYLVAVLEFFYYYFFPSLQMYWTGLSFIGRIWF